MTVTAGDGCSLLPGPTGTPSAPPTSFPLADRRPVVLADDPCEAGFSDANPKYASIYLHARYFDPKLGIFLSPDPLDPMQRGVGPNRYAYGFGNPVDATDRSGLAGTWADCSDGSGDTCWYELGGQDAVIEVGPGGAPGGGLPGYLLDLIFRRFSVNPILTGPAPQTQEPATGEGSTTDTNTGSGNGAVVAAVSAPIEPKPYDLTKARIQSVVTLAVGWTLDRLADNMNCSRKRAAVRGLSAAIEAVSAAEAGAVALGTGIAAVTTSETVVGGVVMGAGAVGFGTASYAGFLNASSYLDAARADWGRH